jgi:hypothetical protein
VTPEEIVRAALARQDVSLQPGSRVPILLHAAVLDRFGREDRGPHLVGRLDAEGRREFAVRVTAKTRGGRDARELLRLGLLDVIIDDGAVRLVP